MHIKIYIYTPPRDKEPGAVFLKAELLYGGGKRYIGSVARARARTTSLKSYSIK